VERWEVIAERAAEVLLDYEQKAGRPAFGPTLNVAGSLEDIAQRCFGLEVLDSDWLEDGVLGELDLEGKKISVQPGLEPNLRAFTVAHDIGHAALNHSPRIVDFEENIDEQVGLDELETQDGVYQAYNSRDRLEIEANLFAAELLAPTKLVLQATQEDPTWTVQSLTEKFGISETAMLTQLANVLLMRRDTTVSEEVQAPGDSDDAPRPPMLNEDQEDAVTTATPALVIAGPGAGKTRVLAERYAWLTRSGKPEDSILALTFSNKAAEEMRVRVDGMLGGGYEEIQTYTFHGFCLELLKSYGHLVGLPGHFTLLTEMDASLLVRRRLHEVGLSHLENLSDPGFYVPGLLDAISRAKDELRSPAEFARLAKECAEAAKGEEEKESAEKTVETAKVYAAYQDWLEEEGYVDYGDLVRLVIEILEENPGAAEEIRGRYGQILVDEFQDINFAMGRLLRALDGGRGVVWAVADPDQSIYRFRGASPANLERFGEDYPDFRTIHLTKNYRSGPDIVGACHGLRSPLTSESEEGKEPPLLEATRPASETTAVSLVVTPDRDAELDHLAEEVRSRKEHGVPLGDQAVLCSSNNQARRIAARLKAAGLAAQGPTSLLGSEELKDALAVVSLLRENDGAGLLRVAAFEENCLSERDVVKLLVWAREKGYTVKEALARCEEVEDLNEEAIDCLTRFGRFLDELPGWRDPWNAILHYAFHPESRMRGLFSDPSDEARRRLLQVGQLAVLARSFGERKSLVEYDGILGFLEYVRELAASNKGNSVLYEPVVRNAVQVMTVHKSKGLEFPVVYVPHLAKGQFPVRNPGGGKVPLPPNLAHHAELEDREKEDRCLFYVALTRAEDELVLSRAEVYGRRAGALPLIDRLVRKTNGRVMLDEREWHPKVSEGFRNPIEKPLEKSNGRQTKAVYSFRELNRYARCSLQFRYAEILGLQEKRSAYQDFHNSVYRVLGEMEMEAKRTGENPELSWAKDLLARVWEEEGPTGHFYEPVYRRHAEKAVENWQGSRRALGWHIREKLSLAAPDGTQIEIMADAIRHHEDGSIVIARHRFGRPRKSHKDGKHNQDRHALYMAAAGETWPDLTAKVELHYLTSGVVVDATPTENITQNRTEKFKGHVQRARAGRYPANPGQECKSCPWNLVCPTSV
jgi:DNA helicase-2/ATP-dependent DNA helicase PcrA